MAAGIKTENIDRMRAEYARGESIRHLAVHYGCCRQTVARYCADVERPDPGPPLSVAQISELLRRWRPATAAESRPFPVGPHDRSWCG